MTGAVDLAFLVSVSVLVAVSIAASKWRPLLWVAVIGASYVISDIGWDYLSPFHAAGLTALCDSAVCLVFYFLWRERWEMWLWRLYQVSVFMSIWYVATILRVAPASLEYNAYALTLEAINAGALFIMLGTGIARLVGGANEPLDSAPHHIHPAIGFIFGRRKTLPFTHRQNR